MHFFSIFAKLCLTFTKTPFPFVLFDELVRVVVMLTVVTNAAYHIPSADIVFIALFLYAFIENALDFAGLTDRNEVLSGSIGILRHKLNRSTADHTLKKRKGKLFIKNAVKLYFVFLYIKKADFSIERGVG